MSISPHPRTLRKAREKVKVMIADGISPLMIRTYLKKWALWWASTSSTTWNYDYLLYQFVDSCWDQQLVAPAVRVG